jgi:hypothetical protein
MNKIILPPAMLSSLLPNYSLIESPDNSLYLLSENFKQKRIVISKLYQLFFGEKAQNEVNNSNDEVRTATHDYFSSYE